MEISRQVDGTVEMDGRTLLLLKNVVPRIRTGES